MAELKQLPPTAAEADQELIRQLCAFLDCKHDVEELIATVEELQGIRQRYREAMTEIASLTAMIATYDEEVTKLTKQRDLAEAREDNAKISRRAGLMLLSAIYTAAGDPERKLDSAELVDRIRKQHLAQAALSEEVKRLRSTLEIYADPSNWARNITYSGSIEPIRIRFVRTGQGTQLIHGFELAQKAIAAGEAEAPASPVAESSITVPNIWPSEDEPYHDGLASRLPQCDHDWQPSIGPDSGKPYQICDKCLEVVEQPVQIDIEDQIQREADQ